MSLVHPFPPSFLLPFLLLSLLPIALCHFRPHLPFFLQKVSAEQRRQYTKIVTSQNDTKAQLSNKLQSWASNAGVVSDFNNFTSAQQQRAQQLHDAVSGNLTAQALQLFNTLWNIRQNDQITRLAECQQNRAALNATGWDHVLQRLVPLPPPSIVGPPASGCFPGQPNSKPFDAEFGPKSPTGRNIPKRGPMAQGRRNGIGTEDEERSRGGNNGKKSSSENIDRIGHV